MKLFNKFIICFKTFKIYKSREYITKFTFRRLTVCAENAYGKDSSLSTSTSLLSSSSLENCDNFTRERFCESHNDEILTMFCEVCRIAICAKCLNPSEVRHLNHEIQSLASAAKLQKVDF